MFAAIMDLKVLTNMTQKIKIVLGFFVFIQICSCDCAYFNEYRLTNSTDDKLKVVLSTECSQYTDTTIYIEKDSTSLLCSEWTGATSCGGPFANKLQIQNINISYHDSLTTIKDYTNYKNWTFRDNNKKGDFSINLTISDFQVSNIRRQQ